MRSLILVTVLTLSVDVSIGQTQTFAQVCTATSPPVLGVHGPRLFVNGQPRFLVLVSYYDAMRADGETLESDFAFLKGKQIDGIRILPLWVNGQALSSTLLKGDGDIRSDERLNHFKVILEKAGQCGFVVDVTFNREQIPITFTPYRGVASQTTCLGGAGDGGIAEVTCRLKGTSYPHVFMDLQNERDRSGQELTDSHVVDLRNTVKTVDPTRIVMTSHQGGGETKSLNLANSASLDVIAYHHLQTAGWYNSTQVDMQAMRAGLRPVYLQEGARTPDRGVHCRIENPEVNPFIEAVKAGKRSGAAAFTLHTPAAFLLASESFQTNVNACPREINFLTQFRTIVDHIPWQIPQGDFEP